MHGSCLHPGPPHCREQPHTLCFGRWGETGGHATSSAAIALGRALRPNGHELRKSQSHSPPHPHCGTRLPRGLARAALQSPAHNVSRTGDLCGPAPMQKRGRLPINHECRGPSCRVVDLQAPQLLFGQRLQRTDMSPLGGVPKMGDCSLRDDNRELQGSHFCGDNSESPSMTDPKSPA